MSEMIRVHVNSTVNNKSIRKEVRNGRDVIIVPSATMPADVIMNGVKYPEDVIKASFETLNRAPAPLGHPVFGGKFVSAHDPEAVNHFHVGAWNENVRWDQGRVRLDKVIDVEFAKRTEGGIRLLEAIDKGEPIGTSTGLLAATDDDPSDKIRVAKEIIFDHDAILLDEEPAATPEQGVGMLVNSAGEEFYVHNLDRVQEQLDWAGEEMVRSIQRAADASLWAKVRDKVFAVIKEAIGVPEAETATAKSEDDTMSADQLKDLEAKVAGMLTKVNELTEGEEKKATTLDEVMAKLNDLSTKVDGVLSAKKNEDDAALEEDKKDVVEAGLMNEEEVKEANSLVVNALAKKARDILKDKRESVAAPLLRGMHVNQSTAAPKLEDHFV